MFMETKGRQVNAEAISVNKQLLVTAQTSLSLLNAYYFTHRQTRVCTHTHTHTHAGRYSPTDSVKHTHTYTQTHDVLLEHIYTDMYPSDHIISHEPPLRDKA